MAVRLRLTRVGGKKDPIWRVVVADQRSPRDGRFIENVGQYNPQTDPSTIDAQRRARPRVAGQGRAADRRTVRKLLRIRGIDRGASRSVEAGWPRCASLLEYLAGQARRRARSGRVEQFEEDDGTIVLELAVAEDDYGKIIGRGGRTANALRTVVKAAAVHEDQAASRRHRRLTAMQSRLAAADWLRAGRVGRPHGLDGSFHVDARGAGPARARRAGARRRRGRCVVRRAGTDERPILRLAGASAARRAEALRGADLLVRPRGGAGARRGRVVRRGPRGLPRWSTATVEVGVVRRAGRAAVVRGARGARARRAPSCSCRWSRDAVRSVDVRGAARRRRPAFLGETA